MHWQTVSTIIRVPGTWSQQNTTRRTNSTESTKYNLLERLAHSKIAWDFNISALRIDVLKQNNDKDNGRNQTTRTKTITHQMKRVKAALSIIISDNNIKEKDRESYVNLIPDADKPNSFLVNPYDYGSKKTADSDSFNLKWKRGRWTRRTAALLAR